MNHLGKQQTKYVNNQTTTHLTAEQSKKQLTA